MRATGVVRRIDDLGRVVLPKEIRKTYRIKEGDSLEIFTDRDGQIILRKYSLIGEMPDFAREYVESLAQVSGRIVLITDQEHVIAVAGGCRNLIGKEISNQLNERLKRREMILSSKGERKFCLVNEEQEENICYQMIMPVICAGDIVGSIIMMDDNPKNKMGVTEQKLAQAAAGFLGRHMEQS